MPRKDISGIRNPNYKGGIEEGRAVLDRENGVVLLNVGNGLISVIDEVDIDLANLKWSSHKNRKSLLRRESIYAVRKFEISGKKVSRSLHRIIAERVFGEIPNGFKVDHRDRNTLNNRRTNLRLSTQSQNLANSGSHIGSKIGYKGVYRNKSGSYVSRLTFEKTTYHLGSYETPEEAALAYDKAALEIQGEFARLNFPERVMYGENGSVGRSN